MSIENTESLPVLNNDIFPDFCEEVNTIFNEYLNKDVMDNCIIFINIELVKDFINC